MNDSGDKSGWRVEHPLIPPSLAEIEAWLDPWLSGRSVLDAELMSGGLMNRNVFLRLAGKPGECVLRIYDRDPSACAREVAVLGMLGRDVPVPRVMYADEDGENGPALAVLSVVDGISLFTLRSLGDEGALAAASYDAGRVLAKIGKFPGPPTRAVLGADLVAEFAARPAFAARIPPAVAERLLQTAKKWESRLAELSTSHGLVHADYNSRNVFVKRSGDSWAVSGILDWEFAMNASPFVDVGNFLRYHRSDRPRYEPHFSRGLFEGGMDLPNDFLLVARFMDLPALCEVLSRTSLPESVALELQELAERTLDEAERHG
jgi:aminoglycoside phosphotransferase (APT) family kinase protein